MEETMAGVTETPSQNNQIQARLSNSIENVKTYSAIGLLAGTVSVCACLVFGLDPTTPATVTGVSAIFYLSTNQADDFFTLGQEVLNNFLADREQKKAKQE